MPQSTKDDLVYRNWVTEEEAHVKYCPKIEDDCLGSECMFWLWQDPEYSWAAESPGDDWVKGDEDDIFTRGEDIKPKRFEWIRPRSVAKGRCGIPRSY